MMRKRDILSDLFLFTKIKEKYSLAKFMATQKISQNSKDAVPLANKLTDILIPS